MIIPGIHPLFMNPACNAAGPNRPNPQPCALLRCGGVYPRMDGLEWKIYENLIRMDDFLGTSIFRKPPCGKPNTKPSIAIPKIIQNLTFMDINGLDSNHPPIVVMDGNVNGLSEYTNRVGMMGLNHDYSLKQTSD